MSPWIRAGGFRRGAAIAAASVAVLACSALVDRADSQCAIDPDCAPFPGTVCVQGGCVAGPAPPEGGTLDLDASFPVTCTSTQDCLSEHQGKNWICRRSDGTCVSLLSEDCSSVSGSYTSDDALLVGAVLPLDGPHATTGAALMNAIELGVSDFDFGPIGGLPSSLDGGLSRPVAVVFCDESVNADRAAQYLIDELDISLLIGTGDSASTLEILAKETSPGGQFLIAPRATADLSGYPSTGRAWRTCPSYAIEADAITALMAGAVEPAIASANGNAKVRVALVHATDVTSTELDARIASTLQLNGAPAQGASNAGLFLDVSYGDPDDPSGGPPDYSGAIAAVTEEASLPDVVILLGSTQAVANVLAQIEADWPATTTTRRPQYVLSSGLQVQELLDYLAASTKTEVAARILGTAPGQSPYEYPNLAAFYVRYKAAFPEAGTPAIFGVPQAYDAFYTVLFAAAVARNSDLVGLDVTNALRLMLGGAAPTPVNIGPDGLSAALAALTSGGTVSLNGASAPLPFDPTTGDVITNVQIWCVRPSSEGASFVFQDSALSYAPLVSATDAGADAGTTGALEGALANGCTL